jgi:SOS-response transcriptional repressor LexA
MTRTSAFTTSNLDALLRWITERAAANRPCPTNDEICGYFAIRSTSTAARMVRRLEEQGYIRVRRFQRDRSVEVIATGQRTYSPANPTPHWRDRSIA